LLPTSRNPPFLDIRPGTDIVSRGVVISMRKTSTRGAAIFVATAAVALAFFSAVDPEGLRKNARLRAEARRVEEANRQARQEIVRLRREAHALNGDTAALERAAREELGYVRPGEVVFAFERKR
jgi:cell division protein FtsB